MKLTAHERQQAQPKPKAQRRTWKPHEDDLVLTRTPAVAARLIGCTTKAIYNRRFKLRATTGNLTPWDAFTLIWMRDRGYTGAEIAELLGRPRQTIYSKYWELHSQ